MPIYEYECRKCGKRMEVWQKFSDPEMERCDSCQGRVKKLISQSAFHLKGSGWYVTDYARNTGGNNQPPTSSSTEKPSAEAGGAGSEGSNKTDSQAAGKAAPSSKKESAGD